MLASGSMPEAYESHLKPVPEVRKSDSSQVSFALGERSHLAGCSRICGLT